MLAKNDETTNDKIEVVGKMLKELNRQLMQVAGLQHEILQTVTRLVKSMAALQSPKAGREENP